MKGFPKPVDLIHFANILTRYLGNCVNLLYYCNKRILLYNIRTDRYGFLGIS